MNCDNRLPCRRKSEMKLEYGCREEFVENEKPQRKEVILIFSLSSWLFGWWQLLGTSLPLTLPLPGPSSYPLQLQKRNLSILGFIVSANWTAWVFFFPIFSIRKDQVKVTVPSWLLKSWGVMPPTELQTGFMNRKRKEDTDTSKKTKIRP